MNFLNGGCLIRYCRIPVRSSPCCKDRVISVPLVYFDDSRPKLGSNTTNSLIKYHCLRNSLVLSNLTTCTQVRYNDNKDCTLPAFHRDLTYPNFDAYRKDEYKDLRKTDWGMGDGKPGYTYAIGFFGWLCGSYAAKSEITHFVSYMAAAADVLAMATIEIELGKIAPGACLSYKWRGKPLFVKHRTQVDIDSEASTPMSSLRDPQTPEQRAPNQQWLVVIGICTHLGCVPIPNSGDYPGGFYCPCHGSHYDNIGRARKGPAPLNLEVPPYVFVSETLVLVG